MRVETERTGNQDEVKGPGRGPGPNGKCDYSNTICSISHSSDTTRIDYVSDVKARRRVPA